MSLHTMMTVVWTFVGVSIFLSFFYESLAAKTVSAVLDLVAAPLGWYAESHLGNQFMSGIFASVTILLGARVLVALIKEFTE